MFHTYGEIREAILFSHVLTTNFLCHRPGGAYQTELSPISYSLLLGLGGNREEKSIHASSFVAIAVVNVVAIAVVNVVAIAVVDMIRHRRTGNTITITITSPHPSIGTSGTYQNYKHPAN